MHQEATSEYDVLEQQLHRLSDRDPSRAQQAYAMLLSNYVTGDGFVVQFGEYDGSMSLEILGQDGTSVVVAPVFKWAYEDTSDSLNEWAVRDKNGKLVPAPEEVADFVDSEIWGFDEFGVDIPRAITFYRRAVDQAHSLAGFLPQSPSAGDSLK